MPRADLLGCSPDEWRRFHDETAHIREMYEAQYAFTGDKGLRISGGDSWYLDSCAVLAEMERRGKGEWTVCFAQVEPDLGRGGFGRWLNPLGEWDWWDPGGCFNGEITGAPCPGGRSRGAISSGPSPGRAALETLAEALEETCGQPTAPEVDVLNDNNIELVATLREAFGTAEGPRIPNTIVLSPGSTQDESRWLSRWPEPVSSGSSEAWGKWRLTPPASFPSR